MPVAVLSTSTIKNPNKYGRLNALNTTIVNPGMFLVKPASIANSGGSASIGTNGQITFSTVTSLSLNQVFSENFENYMVSIRFIAAGGARLQLRLRANGSDNSTASSYTHQQVAADGTTIGRARTTTDLTVVGWANNTNIAGTFINIYSPYLAQQTTMRNISASNYLSAYIEDYASTHNQATSYDGFTLFPNNSQNITGILQVYGVKS